MYSHRLLLSLPVWLCLGACVAADTAAQQLIQARNIIQHAVEESDRLSGARMDNPARNTYWFGPGEKGWAGLPPKFEITPEISRAATIVSDAEDIFSPSISIGINGTNTTSVVRHRKRAGGWWMETLARKGTVPWGNDASYKVFRNVVDYGADPTGQKVIHPPTLSRDCCGLDGSFIWRVQTPPEYPHQWRQYLILHIILILKNARTQQTLLTKPSSTYPLEHTK